MQHGDKCDIWAGEGGQWFAKFKKGLCVFVLKAFKFSRMVAGQIPTGWEAGRYGLPEDIIAQTDRATRWTLQVWKGSELGGGSRRVMSRASGMFFL